jgi:IS5 family transposase
MGGKQLGFSDYELTTAKKQTKREKFLSEMEVVVPWQALIALIEPHYPKTSKKGGRPPYPLATMLRIHLLQQWYSLSDPAMEEALIEVPTMRRFTGIELISDRIPDETTILTFRHLLEKHELGEQIFETVKAHLSARGMTMRQGTIVDATLIAAPSSAKNKDGKWDPEMHQTKKANQWYYGMKVHNRSAEAKGYGVDKDSGLIHSVVTTAANVHDLTPAAELLHGDEEVVYGSGVQGCNAARQAPSATRHSRWKAAGFDRGCKGTRPCQGRAPIPGDQTAVRIPENRAARPGQEQLQNQCDCSSDESVPGTATVTRSSVSKGMVCPNTSIQTQIPAR